MTRLFLSVGLVVITMSTGVPIMFPQESISSECKAAISATGEEGDGGEVIMGKIHQIGANPFRNCDEP